MIDQRIAKALEIAARWGQTDGAHHRLYVIDQMVRALTGCPIMTNRCIGPTGEIFEYEDQGESEEYLKFVADAKDGEDGPDTYSWETGIPP